MEFLNQEWTVSDLLEVNKVIKKIQSESVHLNFHNLGRDNSLKLVINRAMPLSEIFKTKNAKEDILYISCRGKWLNLSLGMAIQENEEDCR
ncbi:hypothetical protein HOLleu_28512 [Holothuria leucospilota]|uniref:Uncharacterized protein n=1 Tax=Holothuria leucospilota TaxID=206669 RepID=A0A9Q1BM26_HOLLE|nr:hypothetical protein HOLleu_28512 [Holothuria leucospilota]